MVSSVSPETEHTPAKAMTVSRESPAAPVSDSSLLWRVPEGTASVPVGGGGARLLCPWATRPGRASRRRTEPHISDQAPPVWRVPEGPEGTGGLRHRPLRAAGSRVAISRAAWPDGAQNTSEAASNKLNRKFRLHRRRGGRRGLAAVPVGGGGAWPGFEPTRRVTHQRPGAAGVEGAGGSGGHRRTGGRRQGLAAVPVVGGRAWLRCPWAAAGPGRASSRRAERSSQRGRRAGGPPPTGTHSGRAPQSITTERPEHQRRHEQHNNQAPHQRARTYKKPTSGSDVGLWWS